MLADAHQAQQIACQPQIQQHAMPIYTQPNTNMHTILPQPMIQMSQTQNQANVNAAAAAAAAAVRKEAAQPTIIVNSNTKYTLPKVGSNQQIFSFNTLTNQITQLSGLTTASLSPMERLLIVPAGINAQQLAQCLMQGQIQFNNTGQPTQSTETKPVIQPMVNQAMPQQSIQPTATTASVVQVQPSRAIGQAPKIQPQLIQQTQPQPQPQPVVLPQRVEQNNKVETPKPKRSKAKKTKVEAPKVLPIPTMVDVSKSNTAKTSMTVIPNQVSVVSTSGTASNTILYSNANVEVRNASKHPPAMIPMKNTTLSQAKSGTPATPNVSIVNTSMVSTSIVNTGGISTNVITIGGTGGNIPPAVVSKNYQQAIVLPSQQDHNKSQPMPVLKPMQNAPKHGNAPIPPLVSVNSSQVMPNQSMSRVQTIQLTPQKQQMLKSVQLQIQTLSSRIQNKSLLSNLSLQPNLGPQHPLYNKPMPSLTNINKMTDVEIYQALQRLFIEQQKILATGKVIPTLPAGPGITNNMPMTSCSVSVTPVITPVVSYPSGQTTPVPTPSINVAKIKQANAMMAAASQSPICVVPPQKQLVTSTSRDGQVYVTITTSTASMAGPKPMPNVSLVNSTTGPAVHVVVNTTTTSMGTPIPAPVIVIPTTTTAVPVSTTDSTVTTTTTTVAMPTPVPTPAIAKNNAARTAL